GDELERLVVELARRLAAFHRAGEQGRSFAVIVPLRPGSQERVHRLLEQGPPFDPAVAGLLRHQGFLSGEEAVFVFEARPDALDELLADPRTWSAAAAWRDSVAGLARFAAQAYDWDGEAVQQEVGSR